MMTQAINLRPMHDEDHEFLYRLYASTREEELSVVPWSEDEKEEFLRMQFKAQHTHYQQHFPRAAYQVVMIGDERIGRLYLERRDEELRIIDIALLPQHRGSGIGGGLMQEILDEAATAGKPVRIHVEKNNPALRLYERLGFRQLEDVGVYWLMEWTAA